MKKLSLFFGLLVCGHVLFAQWNASPSGSNIYNNGTAVNVGIGTGAAFNPQFKLHIYDGTGNGLNGLGLLPGTTTTDNTTLLSIKTSTGLNGFLIKTQNTDAFHGQSGIFINYGNGAGQGAINLMSNSLDFRTGLNYTDNITGGGFGTSALYINNAQQVGIGTTNPGTCKLAVEGTIGARAVKVTLQSPWPDYVFAKTYVLPSLESVAKYIQTNNHLPGIPAADSLAAKGLDLGDNQALLLKKIEELTLYIIEQDKKLQQQTLVLQKQQESIKRLERHVK